MPRREVRGKMRFFAGRTANDLILPTSYGKSSAAREENARQDNVNDEDGRHGSAIFRRQRPERGRFGGAATSLQASRACKSTYLRRQNRLRYHGTVIGCVGACEGV